MTKQLPYFIASSIFTLAEDQEGINNVSSLSNGPPNAVKIVKTLSWKT